MEDTLIKIWSVLLVPLVGFILQQIIYFHKVLGHKASYEWCENTLKDDIEKDIRSAKKEMKDSVEVIITDVKMKTTLMDNNYREIMRSLSEIREAIIGSIDKPGLRTLVNDIEKRIEHIEKQQGL